MAELTQMEMRILAELEEAGLENIPAIANTVTEITGLDAERTQIKEALLNLVHADLIRLSIDSSHAGRIRTLTKGEQLPIIAKLGGRRPWPLSTEDSLELLVGFEKRLRFDHVRKHWTSDDSPYPHILVTDTGRKQAENILAERGYRWWRRENES